MAILDDGYTDIQLLVQLFEEKLSEWKGEYVDKLSISYGAVLGSQNPDWTVDELTALADEKMYWQKRDYYKNASADRRRA
jgi:GGDEF domain-containing protein